MKAGKAEFFHRFVAKLLYLSKRARPDIATAIAFLTTRVKEPDGDDWNKLCRCIWYLNNTVSLALTLEATNNPVIKLWVDASYAVHGDCKSHTGSHMTLGKGSVSFKFSKQNLNTRSSTEVELVAVDDVASGVLWTNYFLAAQGYQTSGTILYQDNKSAILLERNGHWSKGKRSKHISVRYFFIKDRVKSGEMDIEWCPSEQMSGDYFTKSLQGDKFVEFRKKILNLD